MLTLNPNKPNLILRCFGIVVYIILTYLFLSRIKEINLDKDVVWKFKLEHLLILLAIFWFYFILITVLSLLATIKINVDIESGVVTLQKIFGKRKLLISDIVGYNLTVHRNKFKNFFGIRLILADQYIWLAGQNIKQLDELKDLLNEKGLKDHGIIKMKFPFN